MAYSSETNLFQDVAKKADILKVISYYIPVVKQGSRYKAVCPFHNDHHPSMDVNTVRNTFKCWSCGEGGDAISFVEKYEKLSPRDALKKVCSICQIPLPESLSSYKPKIDYLAEQFPKELEARKILSNFYTLSLTSNEGKKARSYLKDERGLTDEVLNHFHIGYAPEDNRQAINVLRKKGIEISEMEKAGILTGESIDHDRYSARIRFPISDNDGHIVAFSGRRFLPDQSGGKYINSPETELFKKGNIRYHFYEAKDEARKCGYIYLVEGYRDAIAFVRAGILSVAALRGTALSNEHIEVLKRLKCEVRLCLDSDEAGQLGEERALPRFYNAGIAFRVLRKFKGAKDADELLTKFGKNELIAQAKRRYDPFLFLLGRQLKGRKVLEDSEEISSFLSSNSKYYFSLNDVSKAKAIEALSRVTQLKDEVLLRILNNGKREQARKETYEPKKTYSKERDYTFSKYRKPIPQIHVSNRNRADNYKQADAFQSVYEKALSYPGGKENPVYKDLVFNETQRILVLPLCRDAARILQENRMDFDFPPFFDLANRVGNIFRGSPERQAFDSDAFNVLEEQIRSASPKDEVGSAEKKEASDETEDEFDFLRDDLSSFSLSSDEQGFLFFAVKFRKRLSVSLYSEKSFKEAIIAHGLLKQKRALMDRIRLEKGGVRDSKDKLEIARIDLRIKSPNRKF